MKGESLLLTGEQREAVKETIRLIPATVCSNRGSVCPRVRLECVPEREGESKAESGELFLYSPLKALIFVALMSGMLLLMYFFYNILGTSSACAP